MHIGLGGMRVGLMGLKSDGTLYAPSGTRLFRAPMWLGRKIQAVQHWIAIQSWRLA